MVYLFAIAVAVVALWIILSLMSEQEIPWTCPACFLGGEKDSTGETQPWCVAVSGGRIECLRCGARFKKAPNGVLVQDR
jgi:hypothetical protein